MKQETPRFLADHPAMPYVAPFAVLMVFLAAAPLMPPSLAYGVRTLAVCAAALIWSRPLASFRASRPVSSILVGIAVFAIWVGPDLLWPQYRQHWLFRNSLTGAAGPSVARSGFDLFFRIAGSSLVVPVAEELFWRGWLMRWLVSNHFEKVPLGAFTWNAFVITAVLFAAEHGAYWDVGIVAGAIYGLWIVKTRNLADCIVAHAVTNACLAAFIVTGGRWQFWS